MVRGGGKSKHNKRYSIIISGLIIADIDEFVTLKCIVLCMSVFVYVVIDVFVTLSLTKYSRASIHLEGMKKGHVHDSVTILTVTILKLKQGSVKILV